MLPLAPSFTAGGIAVTASEQVARATTRAVGVSSVAPFMLRKPKVGAIARTDDANVISMD